MVTCTCSLGHKFQIWGQIWPPRQFGGHSGLKTSLLEVLLTNFKIMEVFIKFKPPKILKHFSEIILKSLQKSLPNFSKNPHKSPQNQILHFPHVSRNSIRSEPCLHTVFPNKVPWCHELGDHFRCQRCDRWRLDGPSNCKWRRRRGRELIRIWGHGRLHDGHDLQGGWRWRRSRPHPRLSALRWNRENNT